MKGYDCALNQVAIDIRVNCGSAIGGFSCSNFGGTNLHFLQQSRNGYIAIALFSPQILFMNAVDTARQEIDSLTSVLLRHAPSATILSTY